MLVVTGVGGLLEYTMLCPKPKHVLYTKGFQVGGLELCGA